MHCFYHKCEHHRCTLMGHMNSNGTRSLSDSTFTGGGTQRAVCLHNKEGSFLALSSS